MVYLRSIINDAKGLLAQSNNVEYAAYLSFRDRNLLLENEFELSPQESLALKGFKREPVDVKEILTVTSKKAIKGVDAASNIFKFSGLYLAAPDVLKGAFKIKYNGANLHQKYYLSLIEPSYSESLKLEIQSAVANHDTAILAAILQIESINDAIDDSILSLANEGLGAIEILILEDLEKALLRVRYIELNSEELVRRTLSNFGNAVQKIISGRRKNHREFEINDEYDVQDILYVILKSVFPNLRDEDPIPKVGAKSTKIDLILREEGILIEVKMIKAKDSSEVHFIEQLKVDFESYHQCQWLDKLFCFVYDPFKKTKDLSNFDDLNGLRQKNQQKYHVEVIVIQ